MPVAQGGAVLLVSLNVVTTVVATYQFRTK